MSGTIREVPDDMPRRLQVEAPSFFHVLNRSVRRHVLFEQPGDYRALLDSLVATQAKVSMPLLAYCIMPNHFHLVLGPALVPGLSRFMHRFTLSHSMRWHRYRGSTGTGPVYQGRFKAYPIKNDTHLLLVCRYVERNPLRADLVARAEQWPWSSLNRDRRSCDHVTLSPWPIPQPSGWIDIVNAQGDRVS